MDGPKSMASTTVYRKENENPYAVNEDAHRLRTPELGPGYCAICGGNVRQIGMDLFGTFVGYDGGVLANRGSQLGRRIAQTVPV